MSTTRSDGRVHKAVIVGAIAIGLAAGSYGIASAASGGPGTGSSSSGTTTQPAPPSQSHGYGTNGGDMGGQPWGGRRSDETVLTGDTAAKVKAAAEAKVPGATVVRVETDADGRAKYEAHMTKADGTPVTVYVNEQFGVVSVESR
jgi:hypothetical protein